MAEEKATPKGTVTKGKLAVVLVRGMVKVTKSVKDTLIMLNLPRKNSCAVVEDNTINKGMIMKVKDYVTWGIINEETLKELQEKRGKEGRKHFTLNPPRKGFGRKGVKIAFKVGGALGDRGEKINDLIKRMI